MSQAKYVAGLRAVEQLLGQDDTDLKRIYAEYQTSNPRLQDIVRKANASGIEIQSANRARLQQISGESRHQGVVAEILRSQTLDEGALRTLVEERLTADDPVLLLILDGIQDPHNLGACLRTADAAGVDAVVVPRHGAAGLGPTVSKVAAGAAETVPFAAVANIGHVASTGCASMESRWLGPATLAPRVFMNVSSRVTLYWSWAGRKQAFERTLPSAVPRSSVCPCRARYRALTFLWLPVFASTKLCASDDRVSGLSQRPPGPFRNGVRYACLTARMRVKQVISLDNQALLR